MVVKQAVVNRFLDICRQRNIKPNELATLSAVTPSTVYSMLDESRKDISIVTIKKLCDGLEITLGEFSLPLNLMSWNRRLNKRQCNAFGYPTSTFRFLCSDACGFESPQAHQQKLHFNLVMRLECSFYFKKTNGFAIIKIINIVRKGK